MFISGTLLVAITASFLKPLLSTNQSLHLPSIAVYDQYNGISPFEENDLPPDGATDFLLTLRLPQLLSSANADFDIKRQFDPWGGKRYSKEITKDEDLGRKRQFSPWGGKRSYLEKLSPDVEDKDFSDGDNEARDSILVKNNGDFSSLNTKRGFNSWGGKRNSNEDDAMGEMKAWDGEQSFKSWVEKRKFKPWGGKRLKESPDVAYDLKKSANSGGKRQAFHSWGGKRGFNLWGGKRAFSTWSAKGGVNSGADKKEFNFGREKQSNYNSGTRIKEQNNSEDDSIFPLYNAVMEGTERNLR